MKIAFNGEWLCAKVDFFFSFWPTFLTSVPVFCRLYALHPFLSSVRENPLHAIIDPVFLAHL